MKLNSFKQVCTMLFIFLAHLISSPTFANAPTAPQVPEATPLSTLTTQSTPSSSNDSEAKPTEALENSQVLLKTTEGEIILELDMKKAPVSVTNFLNYVDSGFYNNTPFHRVIKGFMIQGEGFDLEFNKKPTQPTIKNEAKNGLKNIRGSIAMARTQVVDSASSQFFINLEDNSFLDHGIRDFGYAVFGQVIKGMDIVEKISETPTSIKHRMRDVPVKSTYIIEAKRI